MWLVAAAIGCSADNGDGGAEGLGESSEASGDPTEASATGSSSSATTSASASASATETDSGPKFDIPSGTTGGIDCDCGSKLGFSYVWVANSGESTVSKVNTQTLAEEGRYRTRSDSLGDPSRTSVSLSGRKAAVANRAGGIAAVWAQPEFCDPMENGMAGLQTSSGANDVLAWDQDDCVDWYTHFDYANQRAIAWAPGQLNEACEYENELLWTSGCSFGVHPNIQVDRIDGNTGMVMDHFDVPGFPCQSGRGGAAYGGAIGPDGDFWLVSRETQYAARIDAVTLDAEVWMTPTPAYGMTVDHKSRLWIATGHGVGGDPGTTAYRFDPVAQSWDVANNIVATSRSGILEDAQGRMWINYLTYDGGSTRGLTYIDGDTMQVGPSYDFPAMLDTGYPRGISIDLDGNLWSINFSNNAAVKYDPVAQQWDSYAGLAYPYTYSDMTGWALQNNTCNPEG